MNSQTWTSGRGSAVASFETRDFGTITVSISAFAGHPQLSEISQSNEFYHEYQSTFNTYISTSNVSISEINAALRAQPTPFGTEFAGPGLVFQATPDGLNSIVNVTVDNLHLLDPGVVQRQIVVIEGEYHIITTGIGIGYLPEFNASPWVTEPVWDAAALMGFGGLMFQEGLRELLEREPNTWDPEINVMVGRGGIISLPNPDYWGDDPGGRLSQSNR